ncbi:basic secretory protein-like protein [Kineosporia sp. A_224]|uniref:basic secretory protein-like protein n=1 Tax=Kineosporia sp. A_224 TaxID=1962180 RepID=UPI000B4A688B|nr:basic secretory protein-like protein [Kineosporia sp. A_224]
MRSEGRRAPDVTVRVLDPKVSADTVNGYLDTLADVVPAITDFFNPATTTRIRLVVDPGYTDGPAATGGGVITVSAAYARSHPRDLDVVTHEVTHLIQGYSPGTYADWWHWVEGVADYARYRFGRDNAAAGWSITHYERGSALTDGYRATARFLAWAVAVGGDGIVQDLDTTLRNGTYTDKFWAARTGDDIAALWSRYVRASVKGWRPV